MSRSTTVLSACALAGLALLAPFLLPSCDGNNPVTSGLLANFTPTNTSPPAGTVSMQTGPAAGEQFHVRIAATGLSDVYRAEFRVTYDPASVVYDSAIDSVSFLRDGGAPASFQINSPTAGVVDVVASREPFPAALALSFTPSSTPVPGSLTMQKGTESGDTFQVKIQANGITDFYRTRFHVLYDPASATFVSPNDTASFLRGVGGLDPASFDYQSSPGDLAVVATRLPYPAVVTTTFTPSSPSPASNSVTMQAGTVTGDLFDVRIVATNVNDFFGSAFHVTYDPASVTFVSADDTGSFLRDLPATSTDVRFQYSSSPGNLSVSATRLQNTGGTFPGVDVTGSRDLLVLRFRATGTTTGNALAFGTPREVTNHNPPPTNQIGVTWAGGTAVRSAASVGVNVTGTQDLLVLNFRATAQTAGNTFSFGAPREVLNSSPAPNDQIAVTYAGGVMTYNVPPGVNVGATDDLVVLVFRATAATGGNPFAFGPTPRLVRNPAGNSVTVTDWLGGTATAQ